MKFFAILIIIILLLGSYLIITDNDIQLSTSEGKKSFIKEFFQWIKQVGSSSKNTVGYAVEQDWLPKADLEDEPKTYVVYETIEPEMTLEDLPTQSPYVCY